MCELQLCVAHALHGCVVLMCCAVLVCGWCIHVCEMFVYSCVFCERVFVKSMCCMGGSVCGDVNCAPVPLRGRVWGCVCLRIT